MNLHSSDASVGEFARSHPNIHLPQIEDNWKHLLGKANVLAQLAHRAEGEYLFITDADVIVKRKWITAMQPWSSYGPFSRSSSASASMSAGWPR